MRKAHIEQIRISLVTLRRMFQRKELAALWARNPELDYTELRLLDAVRIAQPTTVGEIAQRLGIDPSRASRQVKSAIERGLLRRGVDEQDGRKVVLEVTKAGAAVQQRGSELTRDRIAMAVEGWSTAEQQKFARLFERFATGMTTDV
jgi:DNA-binding MarR family transcriptional regulator